MIFALLLLACGGPEPGHRPLPPGHRAGAHRPPPGGDQGPPRLPAAEDLSGAWRADLAVAVPPVGECTRVDADGDGFADARACPGGDPATLDCDDTDPTVTPDTERWVRPGPFLMGAVSAHAGADEDPVHVVHLAGFCLDRTEVTAGAWAAWLAAEGRRPLGRDARLNPDGTVPQGRDAYPAEGITWTEARDLCASAGKALPTEAQWEKAARGGCERGDDPARCDPKDLRPYPWGTAEPGCDRANHRADARKAPELCVGHASPVGTTNSGPYGHTELAGNAWEVVADFWHPGVYGDGGERTDPAGATSGEFHVLRGGSWNTFSTNMRVANRFTDMLEGSAIGVRCARPTVPAVPDAVAPLPMVTVSGTLRAASGTLSGRGLYVTAFDAADADDRGRLPAGRSPVAEVRLRPEGNPSQAFTLRLPAGRYLVSAALDDAPGTEADHQGLVSASGGFGSADGNPIDAGSDVDGVTIVLGKGPR